MNRKTLLTVLSILAILCLCLCSCQVSSARLNAPVVTVSSEGIASWEAVENASGYVYVINDGVEQSTRETTINLNNGDVIKVKAVGDDKHADSKWSVSVKYTVPTALQVPTLTISGNVASWNAVDGAIGYVINVNGNEQETDSLQYTSDESFIIKVKALGDSKYYTDSAWSDSVTYIVPTLNKIDAPIVTLNGNVASWSAVQNAEYYVISVNGVESNINALQYSSDSDYTLKVKAIAKNGFTDSDWSVEVRYTTPVATKLSAPEITLNGKVATWTAVDFAQKYLLNVNGTVTETSLLSYTATADSVIKVKAVGDGVRFLDSDWSNVVEYTAPVKLATPQVSMNENVAVWSAVSFASGYTVEVNGIEYDNGTALRYTSDEDYSIRVKATGDGVHYTDSDWSAVVSYTAPVSVQLDAPKVTINGNVSSWSAVENAVYYIVSVNGKENKTLNTFTYSLDDNYTLKVKAVGDGKRYTDSDWSEEVSYEIVSAKLSAPEISLNGNEATWDAVENAVSYTLEINGKVFDGMPLLCWCDTDSYTLRVKAEGDGKHYTDSDWSNKVEYVAPVELSAPQITLNENVSSWNAIQYAIKYVIEVDGVEYDNGLELTYSNTVDYTIRVKAIGDGEKYLDSEWSKSVGYIVKPVQLSAPQITLNGNVSTWEAVENAVSYTLEINGVLFQNEDLLTWEDDDNYIIRVKAVGDGKHYLDSDWSNTVVYKIIAVKLTAPHVTLNGNTASWSAVGNAVTYRIMWNGVDMGTDNVLTFSDDDNYTLKVKAIGDGKYYTDSDWSNVVRYVAYIPTKLTAPHITLNGNVSTWEAVENAVSYTLEINGVLFENENVLSWDDTEDYTIRVKAIGNGREYLDSDWSNTVTYKFVPVTLTAPHITLNGNIASWEAVENAVTYQIMWNGIDMGTDDALTFTDDDDFTLQVKAIGDGKRYLDSEWSNEVSYVVTVKLATPNVTLNGNVASWKRIANANSYTILLNGAEIENVTELSYSAHTSYTLKVKAVGDGVKYLESDWSEEIVYTAPELTHQGTAEDPFTMSDVKTIFETLSKGNIYSLDGVAQKVYIAGYVTVSGSDSGKGYQSRFYIADEKGESQANSVLVYSATFKNGVTAINEGDYVVIQGYVIDYKGTKEIGQSGSDYPVFISRTEPELTDAEKVNYELDALELIDKANADTTVDLPVAGKYTDVTFAWVSNSESAKIENGKLVIVVPETETNVTITVTATLNDASASKSFSIILKKNADGEITEAWQKLTDVADLVEGSQVIIANQDGTIAMSTTQKTNNRGQVELGDGWTTKLPDAVQILTIAKGAKEGTFALGVTDSKGNVTGYLYAASSDKNYLKTQTTLDDNGSFAITVSEDGSASVVAQGTYTKKVMQYNASSSLFACYGSASQTALSLYIRKSGTQPEQPEKTPAEKIAEALAVVGDITDKITANTEITLPLSSVEGVTFNWESDNSQIVIDGGKAIVTVNSTEVVARLTLVATCDGVSDTKVFTITLIGQKLTENEGTAENPFTMSDVKKIFETLKEGDIYSVDGVKQKVYIAGYVTVAGTDSGKGYQSKFYLADKKGESQANSVLVYSATFNNGVTAINEGDYVVIQGYVIDYKGTKEIGQSGSDYPVFISRTEPELNDAEKVNYELDALELIDKANADTTVDLPVVGKYTEVTLVWTSNSDSAKIENGKLIIVVPETENTVTVTATATLNEVCVSKSFSIILKKDSSGEITKTWQKLTDVADLVVGSQIIIVDKDSTVALSTTQKNNRPGVSLGENWTTKLPDAVQILTIAKGTEEGTFAFGVTDAKGNITGYLYAASSGSNYLKTQTTLDNNGSFAINVSEDGSASVVAQGTYTRNIMKYNPNNGNPIFACYSAGQTDIAIYILK